MAQQPPERSRWKGDVISFYWGFPAVGLDGVFFFFFVRT